MKKFILIATLLLSTTIVKAEEQAEEQNDICSKVIFYNPYAQDIVEAGQIFNIQLTSSSCRLRDLIKATKDQYLRMTGFQDLENGNKFAYTIMDFSKNPKITERDCTASSRYENPPGTMMLREVFSKPECGPEIITQDIDPKTGKITGYPR